MASSIAAEGMQLRHKKNILVADDPDVMADQIVRLYGDAGLWLQLSLNGFEAFHTKFSEASGTAKVLAIFDGRTPVVAALPPIDAWISRSHVFVRPRSRFP